MLLAGLFILPGHAFAIGFDSMQFHFDNAGNPTTVYMTTTAYGNEESQGACPYDSLERQVNEYQLATTADYNIAGTGGSLAPLLQVSGQDGCTSYNNYTMWRYLIQTPTIDISGLPAGIYQSCLTVYADGGSPNAFPRCDSFTISRSIPAPTASIWADSTSIAYNTSTNIHWSSTNADGCNIYQNGGGPIASGPSGSGNTGNLTSNQTYSIYCWNSVGSATGSVYITVGSPPSPGGFSLGGNAYCNSNGNNTVVDLNWSPSANASYYNINGNYGVPGGSGITGTSFEYYERKGVSLSYYVTAVNSYGTSDSNTISLSACPAPSDSLSAGPNPVAYNTASTLSYSSANSYVCNISGGNISQSINPNTSGSISTGNLTSGTTYSFTCSDPDGGYAYTSSVTVSVNVPPVPTANISPGSATVGYGGSTTISWSSSNTTSCSVSPTGWSGTSGSQSTGALTSNQTYTVSCTGPGGSVSASTTVTVSGPSVTISANPTTMDWNNSGSTITWSSSNAGSCTASGNWSGSEPLSGSYNTGALAPGTYTYTITCSGNGSAQNSVTVTVSPPVPSASSATYSPPNYCVSGPGGYVAWSYSDPSGSSQSAYDVQITNIGNFNSPFYDSGKLTSTSKVFAIPNGVLQFGLGYKARVMVWNTYDSPSPWSSPTSTFNTPNYAYPQAAFTYLPAKPQQNILEQFTDQTVFGGGNSNSRTWSWAFGDGGTSTTQSPSHTYPNTGSYTVVETVTDAANQTCSAQHILNVQKPIPGIKEVAPR